MTNRHRPALGLTAYVALTFGLGLYFTFASVQGNYGLFRRLEIDAEAAALRVELAQLREDTAVLRNKTRRLGDAYLDIDLLDERARAVLGYVRADEVVLR